MDGATTGDVFTPQSDGRETGKVKPEKEYLTSEGFDFSMMVEESVDAPTDCSLESTPKKSRRPHCLEDITNKYSFRNIVDGSYDFGNFDPFGVRCFEKYSKDFACADSEIVSPYTHPALIMEEVKKKPYNNIFVSSCMVDEDVSRVEDNNIATLAACLQRSVMLPLTYQLEVVNNSILTHFLVNLDMYEHLRSLKDYFFLMDGEFSRSICHNLFAKLTKTVNPQELLNFATLHNILDKALGSSISRK